MSKLVDKERLAKLAQALDARAKAAVAAEKERALAAEQAIDAKANANAAAIATINHEENGILAQAKSHAQGLVDGEKEDREEAEGLLAGRIETLEGIVGGEAEGALGQVKKDVADNKTAITTLNSKVDVEGSVTKAITDAVAVEKERAEGAEQKLSERIAATETFVAAQPAIDKAQNDRLETLEKLVVGGEGEGIEKVIADVADAKAAAEAAQSDVDAVKQRLDDEGGLVDRIEANEANIAKLDGAVEVEGSVKKQIADAIAGVKSEVTDGLTDRVEELETFKNTTYPAAEQQVRKAFADADTALETKLQGNIDKKVDQTAYNTKVQELVAEDSRIAGLVASEAQTARAAEEALADRLDVIEGEGDGSVKKALQDAKAYADQEITKLVDSAPDAMNTLNELAEAIKGNKNVYDAYVEQHAAAMTKMKEDLQKEIDNDVKAVVDAQKLVNDAQTETNEDFEARIAANEAFVKAHDDTARDARIKALEDANKEGGAVASAIQAAQDAADAADDKAVAAQAAIDAVEERLDAENGLVDRLEAVEAFKTAHSHDGLQGEIDAVEGRVDALETFKNAHDHSVMEKGIADNKAAIEKEVKDRDAAIEEALKVYSTTEEMKQVIGNVVNSLALTMENDKVVLKLGGAEGIALTSVSLDLVTDDDIDTIIAGLGE